MQVKVRELYMRDKVVKKLFTSFSGYQYLARIVCEVLDLPSELFSFQIFHPSVGVNENVVNSEVDLIIEDDEAIVNIEINTSNSRSIQNKNTAYFCHLILKQIKTSKDYDKVLKKVYQINLNSYDVSHKERFVTRSRLIDVETKEEVHPILEIVDVYLAKIIKTDDLTTLQNTLTSLEEQGKVYFNEDENKYQPFPKQYKIVTIETGKKGFYYVRNKDSIYPLKDEETIGILPFDKVILEKTKDGFSIIKVLKRNNPNIICEVTEKGIRVVGNNNIILLFPK